MGTALSLDIRQRIVDTYQDGEGSYKTLATRFRVSPGSVQNVVHLYRDTGSIEPKPHSGGKAHQKLFDLHYNAVEAWLEQDPNLTWPQVADKLADEYGLSIHSSQLSRQLKRRGYSRKKTPHVTPK